jgi:hypothetical protein
VVTTPEPTTLVPQDQAIKLTGKPETPNAIPNLKIGLLTEWCFHTDSDHAQYCLEQLLTQQRFDASSHDTVPSHTYFLHHGHQLSCLLISSCSTKLIPLGLIKNKVQEIPLVNTDDLKQQIPEGIQGIPKAMLQVVTYFP